MTYDFTTRIGEGRPLSSRSEGTSYREATPFRYSTPDPVRERERNLRLSPTSSYQSFESRDSRSSYRSRSPVDRTTPTLPGPEQSLEGFSEEERAMEANYTEVMQWIQECI